MEKLILTVEEKKELQSKVEDLLNTYHEEIKSEDASTIVFTKRLLDDLNNILQKRGKIYSSTPRLKPEDNGDEDGIVKVTI